MILMRAPFVAVLLLVVSCAVNAGVFNFPSAGAVSVKRQVSVTIDGGGSAITTGAKKVYLRVPYDMTVTGWDIVADQSGSIVVDVWKDSYANFPPTVADTIAGTEKPTLSSALKNQDVSLSSFTTTIVAGQYLEFNVDSAATVTKVMITLYGVGN